MSIDWLHFTPWTSLLGGVLIGLAAAAFVLLNGRIAGVSGLLGGLLRPARGDLGWRIAFMRLSRIRMDPIVGDAPAIDYPVVPAVPGWLD